MVHGDADEECSNLNGVQSASFHGIGFGSMSVGLIQPAFTGSPRMNFS
jgi:hypothetical protein